MWDVLWQLSRGGSAHGRYISLDKEFFLYGDGGQRYVLEMIRGGPSTLGDRRNELFAGHLMGTDSAGGTLWNVRTREIKGQMTVMLRTASLA